MTKYVNGPDVALRLAHYEAVISGEHRLLAPTLLRSQLAQALKDLVMIAPIGALS